MFFNKVLAIFCIFQVNGIQSYILHLNINELNDNPSRTQHTDIVNEKLLNEIINVVEKQQDGLTNMAVHKCLKDRKTKATKLRCIKELAEKRKRDRFKEDKINIDLTRSGENLLERSDFADDYIDFFSLRSGTEPKRRSDVISKNILRTNYYSDDSDSDVDIKRKPKYSVKRFKPKKTVKDPYSYMQAPSRVYDINLDRRRRLPHFLPKRQHWDEEDFKNLRNYWIHGTQGKYPGSYRIPV